MRSTPQASAPCPIRPPRRHAGGFTLIEAMVAMTVLAFGLLTLAAMQLHAFRQGSAGRHTQDAGATVRAYVEQVQRIPWTDLDTAQAAGTWTNPSWTGAAATVSKTMSAPGGGPDPTEKTYAIQWLVTNVLVGGNPDPCLRDVAVRVRWQERDRGALKALELKTRRYNWGGASC